MGKNENIRKRAVPKETTGMDLSSKISYENLGHRQKGLSSRALMDPMEALKLRRAGFSFRRIGELLTPRDREKFITEQAVQDCLMKLVGPDKYKELSSKSYLDIHRQELKVLLEEKHMMALKEITPKKLKGESAKDNAMTAKMIHEQLRLEKNQSTQNTAHSFIQIVEKSTGANGL